MINKHPYMQEELAADCTAVSLALLSLSNKELGSRIMIQNGLKLMTQDNAVKNADIETKYLDDPDYGLKPEKPVFINGFGPHHIYLDSLCTEEGVMLKNNRRGSMPVDGIEGPVDIYDLFLPNEKKYMTIYLCLYGRKNSVTTPRGLCFREEA